MSGLEGIETRNGLYGFEFREPDERRVEERKTPDIKALWQRNHEIVNLAARGFKGTEIAEILHIHPQTVSNTLNSELGQKKLSEIRLERDDETKKVTEKIRVITNKALNIYQEAFDDEIELTIMDKVKVANTVMLELSGHRAPIKTQTLSAHMQLSPEELQGFKDRGIAAGLKSGRIINVEPETNTETEAE